MALNPEKHKKFKMLSQSRLQDIKTKFRLLDNLASSNYEFTKEEVDELFTEIEKHLGWVKETYQKRLKKLNQI